MSPKLEDCRSVYLVDMTNENGEVLSLLPKSAMGE